MRRSDGLTMASRAAAPAAAAAGPSCPSASIRRLQLLLPPLPLLGLLVVSPLASAFGWRLPMGSTALHRPPQHHHHHHQPLWQERQPMGAWGLGRGSTPTTSLPMTTAAAATATDAAEEANDDQTAPPITITTTVEEESFTVDGASGWWAMDIVLARQYPRLSRRACRRLLQEGFVKVDGKVMRRFAKVPRGAVVCVTLPQAGGGGDGVEGGAEEAGGGGKGAVGGGLLGLEIRPEPMNLT